MTTSYKELSPSKTASTLKIMDDVDGGHGFHPDHTRVMARSLSFAQGWQEIVAEDFSSMPHKSRHYLMSGDVMFPVQYSSDPYQDSQFDRMDLDITVDNVFDYTAFYHQCFLFGSHKLKPVLHFDDIAWQDDLPPMARKSLDKELQNYPKIKSGEGDIIIMSCPCVFKQAIMVVTFEISGDGEVTICDRSSLMEDLPVKNFA